MRRAGKLDEAIAAFDEALKLQPDDVEAERERAQSLLLKGDFERGWPAYDVILKREAPKMEQPLWDGSHLLGQRILLRAGEDLGETIQFIRYAPMVAERGGKVIVQCPPQLRRLLEGQCRIKQVISSDEAIPTVDSWFPIAGLPGLFQTTLESIPSEVPYLLADAESVDRWETRLRQQTVGLKVGLVEGSKNGDHRPQFLDALAPLAMVADVQFFNVQREESNEAHGISLVDWSTELRDLADSGRSSRTWIW